MSNIKVRIERKEALEKVLRQFKRLCNNAGIFREIKRNSFYEKPCERRRREEKQREKNIKLAQKGRLL